MQRTSFEVSIDSSRTDSFVTVSNKFITSNFSIYYGSNIPPVVPLQLSDGKKDTYVGCLTRQPHNLQPFKLIISILLAEELGLKDGEIIECTPIFKPAKAARVLVLPASVDDSEVVEQNAFRIEAQLLKQVQVVFLEMTISVAVFSGVHAKVKVQKIEDTQGNEINSGCAIMFEGTEFVIATRTRQTTQIDTLKWSVLRCYPYTYINNNNNLNLEVLLYMNSITAKRNNWTEGIILGFWDLSRISEIRESKKITPSFLRNNAWKAPIKFDENLPDGVCSSLIFGQTSSIVIFPNPDENIPKATNKDIISNDNLNFKNKEITFEELKEVHGEPSQELLQHLKTWFTKVNEIGSQHCIKGGNGNVLLCGGKGYGKTTFVETILKELPNIYICVVQCNSGNNMLSLLQESLIKCVLCAPSVLILDNFDNIAPVQKEGSVNAISGMTKSILEDTLQCFTNSLTFNGQSSVIILATCTNREDVNENLRTASCFSKIIKLEPLNRKTRFTLLEQIFPNESKENIEQMNSFLDNYTPFDIKKVSSRIKNSFKDGKISSLDKVRETINSFTPLSHTGISFLKGEKQSLNSIGGLYDAKKILYDTLVLPMKHPELFARLPLKTRSGVLLYGPSGCGKTFVVEAVVNSENLNCIVVNGPEVFGKYIGQSEQKIRDVFERAQAAAPCVVFFDEFDSVAPQRGVDNSGVTDRVVNQLLCYLDGVEGRKDVYVVAASSRPDLIDAALLRPGRLDKAVQCPIPSFKDRMEILTNCFKNVSAKLTEEEIENIAKETVNWTPADLSGMVSSANMFVNRRVIDKLSNGKKEVNNKTFDFALANLGKGTTREKIEDALKPLLGITTQKENLDVENHIVLEDVKEAMGITRPSLTQKDILKYERIHRIFSGQETERNTKKIGKKLALQ